MPENTTLSPKQRKALEALITTGDTTSAADAAGVHRDTLYRWLKQPLFATMLREAEAQAIDEVARVLIRLSRSAVGTLAQAMAERDAPIGPRIRAADITLSRLLQVRELAVLEERLTALEQAAGIGESRR
jgi:transcriptional regulator of acetoin/glycerol metabolism